MVACMIHVQPMERAVQGAPDSNILKEYAGPRAERHQKMVTENSAEQFTT